MWRSSIKVSASEGVFTLSQQVCVNMRLVKYETGLPRLLSQTKQIQITRTSEMWGFCCFSCADRSLRGVFHAVILWRFVRLNASDVYRNLFSLVNVVWGSPVKPHRHILSTQLRLVLELKAFSWITCKGNNTQRALSTVLWGFAQTASQTLQCVKVCLLQMVSVCYTYHFVYEHWSMSYI